MTIDPLDLQVQNSLGTHTLEVNRLYLHYKGNRYRVYSYGRIEADGERGEIQVIYSDIYDTKNVWIRPISEWFQPIEENGVMVTRFSLIDSK